MLHLLDNPVWNGLISGNGQLANGNSEVKYFDKEVSPLIGLKEYSEENFAALYQLITEDRTLATVTSFDIVIPPMWAVVRHIKILQMVYNSGLPQAAERQRIMPLQKQDVPAMLALTQLTNPGPFAERTIDFGNYEGIFNDAQLIAMAGQRTQPLPFIEVSAVCTHPNHHGKGNAATLIKSQIQNITATSNTPFLHVRDDNYTAISLYKKLGFSINQEINFTVIKKN